MAIINTKIINEKIIIVAMVFFYAIGASYKDKLKEGGGKYLIRPIRGLTKLI
jgi:hypothetical protein